MDLMLTLFLAMAFPVGCLIFVLWMERLEDSLPDAIRRTARKPDPEPVLAIPVRRPAQQVVTTIPAQRTESHVVPAALKAAESAAHAGTPAGT